MRTRILLALAGLLSAGSLQAAGQRNQKEEPPTQTLEIPKEPPQAVVADTDRLVFYVSPLSSKGLLSQQVRDALKALFQQAGRSSIVRIRAFAAGTGDIRRVQAVISETFTARKLPIPVVTVVQIGALPMPGVQVVMEATALSRQPVNPQGLAFVSGQAVEQTGLPSRMFPLAQQALPKLRKALAAAGMGGRDVLQATCFVTSMDDVWELRRLVASEFPKASLTLFQSERAPSHAVAGCQLVARLRAPAGAPLRALSLGEPPAVPGRSDVALVSAPRVVLAGSQMAFGYQDEDALLAWQRLGKTLEQEHSSIGQVVSANLYVLSRSIGDQAQRTSAGFWEPSKPPAWTMIPCVGLPSLDASFAIDAVSVATNSQ
jgi:enamine deaminase RidA (YjgF/YER057c/UK114 family)